MLSGRVIIKRNDLMLSGRVISIDHNSHNVFQMNIF
jgi:hypothetical protein